MTIQDYLHCETQGTHSLAANATAVLLRKEGRFLKAGGQWIYDNEIDTVHGSFENGDIISVEDFDGYFLGYGMISLSSRIRIRMLSRKKEHPVTASFLYDRVKAAWDYRKKVIDTSSCRVIFGEADFLPGLTVDKYEDILVAESLSLGIDRLKTLLLADLVQILAADGISVRGIYERSDASVREKEGLQPRKGFLSEPFETRVQIMENGVKYIVDVENGQKTGFFLDQKLNRAAIHRICENADVLDCFTHTGSFALNAACAGASHVTAVDASETAIAQALENARLNGFEDRMDFVCADVFSYLPDQEKEHRLYDVVILDPPAFTKSRNTIQSASRGYREINHRGMRLVRNGGYLVTCTCSHFMDPEHFRKVLDISAHDAHKRLRQIEFRTQAPDHPILWANDTSYYLKLYIFQVIDEL